MIARRELYAAVMTGGPHSPDRSEKASQLIDAFRDEALAEQSAEVDQLRAALSDAADQVAELESELGGATAKAAALESRMRVVGTARTYQLESGKKFIYVEDIADAVLGRQGGAS